MKYFKIYFLTFYKFLLCNEVFTSQKMLAYLQRAPKVAKFPC